jgi:hypothetical protein
VHDAMLVKENVFGRTYGFLFNSACMTYHVADKLVRTTQKTYVDTFPNCKWMD